MKLILSQDELLKLIKNNFPPTFLPANHVVYDVETKGYPIREFEITFMPKPTEGKEDKDVTDDEAGKNHGA